MRIEKRTEWTRENHHSHFKYSISIENINDDSKIQLTKSKRICEGEKQITTPIAKRKLLNVKYCATETLAYQHPKEDNGAIHRTILSKLLWPQILSPFCTKVHLRDVEMMNSASWATPVEKQCDAPQEEHSN